MIFAIEMIARSAEVRIANIIFGGVSDERNQHGWQKWLRQCIFVKLKPIERGCLAIPRITRSGLRDPTGPRSGLWSQQLIPGIVYLTGVLLSDMTIK